MRIARAFMSRRLAAPMTNPSPAFPSSPKRSSSLTFCRSYSNSMSSYSSNSNRNNDNNNDTTTTNNNSSCSNSSSTNSESKYVDFGNHVFRGDVARPYLEQEGLAGDILELSEWSKDKQVLDKVARAVLAWAKDRGGFAYCHWFQPLGASYVRHGQTAQVQNSFVNFDKSGKPVWEFKGKQLLQGETDGSSFPNGGTRATHSSGAYLAVDPTSPIFLRGDTVFIPSCLKAFTGESLDEKTPLLRASDALSREGSRLLHHLGYKVNAVSANIGLEQELFFVPRSAYKRRPDLQMAGRTLIGRLGPRGQELSDHYMAAMSSANPVLKCMQEIQDSCFKIGIPLKTRHREVAPNQFEFAPMYGNVTTQIDQNLSVMQIIDEIAVKYDLAALFSEKPFQGVNGSGKHNNWSLSTEKGINLFNVSDVSNDSKSDLIFPIVMAAIVKAVDKYGDLLRMSISCPGNDFRLGACEAPPAILSMYLGDDMTKFLNDFKDGKSNAYIPANKQTDFGASAMPTIEIPAEDRNRTSPFTFGGHRFEFRAVGASQNVSLTNTVLSTIVSEAFRDFSLAIEAGATPRQVAQDALTKHWKVVFNGNGYDLENQKMLTEKGLWRIDSGVDAISKFTDAKNIKLFSSSGVLSETECIARQQVMFSHYIGLVEVEANCLIDMMQMQLVPMLKKARMGAQAKELIILVEELNLSLSAIHAAKEGNKIYEGAALARSLRLETMIKCREVVDKLEGRVDSASWPFASYKDLLFLDQN